MMEQNRLTYAAIITIALPGMDQPATVSVTLTPQTAIETSSGQLKPLRECSLAELQTFADALEAELWARYQDDKLGELASGTDTQIKITVLDDGGHPHHLEPEAWLEHAIVLDETVPVSKTATFRPEDSEKETEAGGGETPAPADRIEKRGEASIVGDSESTTVGGTPAAEEEAAPDTEGTTAEGTEEETKPAADTAQKEAARTEAARTEVAPDNTTGPDVAPAGIETETVPDEDAPAPAVAEPEEAGVAPVTEEDTGPAGQEVEATLPVAPPREETPVVPGPEPRQAPEEMEPPVAAPELRIAGLRRPPGHPTPAAVDILINESAFRDTQAHALTSLNREVAGMLIGPQPEKQPDGRYVVHITDVIIARHTRMHGASVTYTPESWRYVTDVLQERYPKEEAIIVGWYHTHPGFGIFLSGMDLFIHQHFFTQKWHVALVLDPLARKSGFFCWNRGQEAVQPYDFPWPPWAQHAW